MVLPRSPINVQGKNISNLYSFLQTTEEKSKPSMLYVMLCHACHVMLYDTVCNLDSDTQQRQNEKGKLEPNLTHECKCQT